MGKSYEVDREVEVITFDEGEPDPNCKKCDGTGNWKDDDGEYTDLPCSCTFIPRKEVKEIRTLKYEPQPDGGMKISGL